MGYNKYFLCDFLFVLLNFFFFPTYYQNTVEDGEKGWGLGASPRKN